MSGRELTGRLRVALRILPAVHRPRYREEWAADLAACGDEGVPPRQIELGALRLATVRRARESWQHTRPRRVARVATLTVLAALVLMEWVGSQTALLLTLLMQIATAGVLVGALRGRADRVLTGCAALIVAAGLVHLGLEAWWGGRDFSAAMLPGGGWDLSRAPFDLSLAAAQYQWWSLLGAPFSSTALVPWQELGQLRAEPGAGAMFAAAIAGWAALFVGWGAFLIGLARWLHVKRPARSAVSS